MASDIDGLLDSVRKRWNELSEAPYYRETLRFHLESLADDLTAQEYDSEGVVFPDRIHIAYAICKCGVKEFIVDGSTQECQTCGSLMFRTEVAVYEMVQPTEAAK